MRGRRLIRAMALTAAVVASAAAPVSAAGPSIIDDFGPDGVIDPCKHTTAQLQKELEIVGPDIEQYAADYPVAIEEALEARARGECGGAAPSPAATGGSPGAGPGSTDGPATPAGGAPAATPTAAPAASTPTADPAVTGGEVVPPPPVPAGAAPRTATGAADPALERAASRTAGGDAPLPVVLLGALAAAVALAVLTGLAVRRLGLAGERLAPAGHAWREAAWRAGGTWADFRDWVRLGR